LQLFKSDQKIMTTNATETAGAAMRRLFLKNGVLLLLALFVIPVLTLWFSLYVLEQEGAQIFQGASALQIEREDGAAVAIASLSDICALPAQFGEIREQVCPSFGEIWQFDRARVLALWTLIGGAVFLGLIALLGWLAFINRRLRLTSFIVGRWLMMCAGAATTIIQGGLSVWLSFWLTGYFGHSYYPKLILVVGLFVLVGISLIVREIFRKPELNEAIDGELVDEAAAPRLWSRIRQMAGELHTAPPRYLIAGIDTNFFVTEAPLSVQGQRLEGRKLFVSIPLLRQLEPSEADAVLAHELAHFAGGDTQDSAQLGPRLMQYDLYLNNIRNAGVAFLVWPFMDFYRLIFELALARDSRTREHQADSTAAKLVSAEAIARSLVKIGAYATYRSRTESELFDQHSKLDENLGIATRIAQGLHPWANSPAFTAAMTDAHIPHPFDSHPPLDERMRGVSCVIAPENFAQVVTTVPAATWADEIQDAEAVEARLWSGYEKEFAQAHEESLAYRYDPTKEGERELVLKYFPPQQFKVKKGTIEINCEAIVTPEGEAIAYDAIKGMSFQDPNVGSNYLQVTLHEKSTLGHKKVKISFAGLEDESQFQSVLQNYWSRHGAMRAFMAGQ
jgi:Zn-dependent protease with chaperone function